MKITEKILKEIVNTIISETNWKKLARKSDAARKRGEPRGGGSRRNDKWKPGFEFGGEVDDSLSEKVDDAIKAYYHERGVDEYVDGKFKEERDDFYRNRQKKIDAKKDVSGQMDVKRMTEAIKNLVNTIKEEMINKSPEKYNVNSGGDNSKPEAKQQSKYKKTGPEAENRHGVKPEEIKDSEKGSGTYDSKQQGKYKKTGPEAENRHGVKPELVQYEAIIAETITQVILEGRWMSSSSDGQKRVSGGGLSQSNIDSIAMDAISSENLTKLIYALKGDKDKIMKALLRVKRVYGVKEPADERWEKTLDPDDDEPVNMNEIARMVTEAVLNKLKIPK